MQLSKFIPMALIMSTLIGCASTDISGHDRAPSAQPKVMRAEIDEETSPAFTARISCQAVCANEGNASGESIDLSTNGVFDPANQLLRKGNGNLLAPLTVALSLWGEGLCVQKAAEFCGSQSAVRSASLTKMRSGKWEASFPIGCDVTQERVVSPWDPKYLNDLAPAGLAPGRLPNPSDTMLPGEVRGRRGGEAEAASCKHWLKGNLCFGDCMDINADGSCPLCLATSKPGASGRFDVCADPFLEAINEPAAKANGTAWAHWACESYFWKSIRSASPMEAACAAVRGETGCDALLRSLSARSR